MGKLFNPDSPVMRFLGKMADLMILNVIVTICCLPILTVGAAITAMNYVVLKMVRGEEGYIVKDFFKSFKMNFRQATGIWCIMLVFILIFIGDYWIVMFSGVSFPEGLNVVLMAVAILLFVVSTYIFPVLARFDNTVRNTIKNGCIMSIMAVPKAILMAVLIILPVAVLYFTPQLIPLVILFGFSAPAYLSAMMYSGTLRKFEPQQEEETVDEEFHVLMDEEEETVDGEDTENGQAAADGETADAQETEEQ